MKEKLIKLLEPLGYPVRLQGSLNPDEEYPATFFTFWNFETPETSFYDNAANAAIWGFWLYLYSENAEILEETLEKAHDLLNTNGWIASGRGEDVASDVNTHTGRMIEIYYIENYEREA